MLSIHVKSRYTILIHRFHRDAIFFFFVRPRRYASRHVLFYDCARNERDAREKVENERVDGCARISKTRNWPAAINHSPVVRLFDSFRSVPFRGHPERVRCLISLSDSERHCRCCTTSLRVTTGYAYASRGGPRAWADALHRVTRTHTYALAHTSVPFNDSLRFLSFSRAVRLCPPLALPY